MRHRLLPSLLIVVLAFLCNNSWAQKIEPDLKGLASDSWKERANAFDNLLSLAAQGDKPLSVPESIKILTARSADAREQLTAALVVALTKENALVEQENERILKTGKGGLSDEHNEFYGQLVQAVCSLQDPHAASPLLQIIDSGDMVVNTVASFGSIALPDAFKEFTQTNDGAKRAGLVLLFGKMLQPQNVEKVNQQDIVAIRNTLFHTASDGDYTVRLASVRGLGWLMNDAETTNFLHELALKDPALIKAARQSSRPQEAIRKPTPNDPKSN
jgi:hypothetical protein